MTFETHRLILRLGARRTQRIYIITQVFPRLALLPGGVPTQALKTAAR